MAGQRCQQNTNSIRKNLYLSKSHYMLWRHTFHSKTT